MPASRSLIRADRETPMPARRVPWPDVAAQNLRSHPEDGLCPMKWFTVLSEPCLQNNKGEKTMKFLCLAYLDRGLSPGPDVVAEYGAMTHAMQAAGGYVDSGQLASGDASKVVRITAGEDEVREGRPPAAGQGPAAYFVIDCADLKDALDWAGRIPAAAYGSIEVRPPR